VSDRSPPVAIEGWAEPGFEPLRRAFARNFADHGDVGAACCLYADGRPVADLWGGRADPETGAPWATDTIQLVFSTTKGVTAIAVNRLVERGELDLDTPVAEYWPEFGAAGKGAVPVRWVLSHQAGLPVVDGDFTLAEALTSGTVARALARQAPAWEPGSAHGYHMRTWGWLLGELARRVTGRGMGELVARELAEPLGLDFWIGLPPQQEPRCATVVPPRAPRGEEVDVLALAPAGSLLRRAATGPSDRFRYDRMWNRRDVRAAEMPSSNGIGDARSLARVYAALLDEVDGVRVLAPETVRAATRPQARGPDRVIMTETSFGLGFMLPPSLIEGGGPAAFGHAGAGGSFAFADPEAGFAFAYVMNQLRFDFEGDPRARGLVRAVYESVRRR
jgi:CubicO group peptidase (beta-lactamase class C family)